MNRAKLIVLPAAVLLAFSALNAETLVWTGSDGAWDASSSRWSGSALPAPWDSSNGPMSTGIFDTVCSPTVSGVVYANGIIFSNSVILSGGTITLAGASPSISLGADVTVNSSFAGTNGVSLSAVDATLRTTSFAGNNSGLSGNLYVGSNVYFRFSNNNSAGSCTVHVAGTALINAGRVLSNNFVACGGLFDMRDAATLNGNICIQTNTTIFVLSQMQTINGVISNTAPATLTFSFAGVPWVTPLKLTAANLFNGTVTLLANTTTNTGLFLANGNALQYGTLACATNWIWFGSNVADRTFTFGGLSATNGTLPLTNMAGEAVTLLVGNNNSSTISGAILAGPGSLTKVGTGTLTLTNVNTYSGATVVSNGMLDVSASGSLASTNWTVLPGGTLSFGKDVNLTGKVLTIDAGGSTSGRLLVTGDLIQGGFLVVTNYVRDSMIAQCSGTLSGGFEDTNVILPSRCILKQVNGRELWIRKNPGTVLMIH